MAAAGSSRSSRGNILVVDDTPANLRLLSDVLTEQGYKVRPAPGGALALQAARAMPPELILLDINMPGMNGYEVCQKLKADERTRDVPVLFISALGETFDKVRAFAAGGVDYITKPLQFEEVLARIETHLSLSRLQRELEGKVAERTAELARLNAAYERFVPREFLGFLQKRSITDVGPGDQIQREMTVLFADIRDFTALSERMTPQENFDFLNGYLGRLSPIIRRFGGFIDKYIGDSIMALFPERAEDGLGAAVALCGAVSAYNRERQAVGRAPLRIGIGVHTGSLMLGILGEAERMQGTVISDAVNLASRLEGLTRMYGASVITSEQTLQRVDAARYDNRHVGSVRVKGKQAPVSVYEVFDGDPPPLGERKRLTQPDFAEGLRLYVARSFAEACVRFDAVVRRNPDDRAARLYLERAARYMLQGVPADWAAVENLTEK